MVTLIKVEKEVGTFKAFKIFGDFEDYNETNLFDRMLSKDSECDKYEYLYVFLQNHEVESLKKIIVENGLVIFDVLDFTSEFTNMLMTNDTVKFKDTFEEYYDFDIVIEHFYKTEITVDMVLDKANNLGFSELTDNDYSVLKQKNHL